MTTQIGSLIIDLNGQEIDAEERELINHPLIGGVILFTRNYDSRQQVKKLIQTLRTARKEPLLIMVDQEGGRVQRFKNEFTRLPQMAALGEYFDKNSHHALEIAKNCGWLMATEILTLGIDLSLAPVVDLKKYTHHVIGDRGFHLDPQIVLKLAQAFMDGMAEAGMTATAKHFPGHGTAKQDSHIEIAWDERTLDEIKNDDMLAFTSLIKAGLKAIMPAHVIFNKLDEKPASLSRFWLQTILREQLKFKGVIISDDLNMKSAIIADNCADRMLLAREAGCDFVLLCNNRSEVINILDEVPYSSHRINYEKWSELQGRFHKSDEDFKHNPRWQQTKVVLEQFN